MTDEEREELLSLLRSKQEVPKRYCNLLWPEDIDVPAVVSRRKVCGQESGNILIHGDSLDILDNLCNSGWKGRFDVLYIDPPFDVGKSFSSKDGVFAYSDRWRKDSYISFLRARITAAKPLLKEEASIFVHCDYRRNAHIRLLLDEIFGESALINEIIWCYKGTGRPQKSFKRKHDTIFFYRLGKGYFDKEAASFVAGEQQRKKFTKKDEKGYYKEYQHPDGSTHRSYWKTDQRMLLNDWWEDKKGYLFFVKCHQL